MLACCNVAALPWCPLHSHSRSTWGSAAQASSLWPAAPRGGSLGPRITEKSTDFGLGWTWLPATMPLTWPHTGYRADHRQGDRSKSLLSNFCDCSRRRVMTYEGFTFLEFYFVYLSNSGQFVMFI